MRAALASFALLGGVLVASSAFSQDPNTQPTQAAAQPATPSPPAVLAIPPAERPHVPPTQPNPESANIAVPTVLKEAMQVRDPFQKPTNLKSEITPQTELEAYAVEQFRMVGVITGPDRVRAMVIGPNNKTYLVAPKMRIGNKNGVVRQITPQLIRVRERVTNVLGIDEELDVEIKLPSESDVIGKPGG